MMVTSRHPGLFDMWDARTTVAEKRVRSQQIQAETSTTGSGHVKEERVRIWNLLVGRNQSRLSLHSSNLQPTATSLYPHAPQFQFPNLHLGVLITTTRDSPPHHPHCLQCLMRTVTARLSVNPQVHAPGLLYDDKVLTRCSNCVDLPC